MTELLYSCASTLDQPVAVYTTDYGTQIIYILLSKTEVTAAGNVPTAAELGTAYTNGTLLSLRVASCNRMPISDVEIEIFNKEHLDKRDGIQGKVRLLSEAIARACEKVSLYEWLYMYYITDKNYCFGSYTVKPYFGLRVTEGSGNPIYIDFKLDFYPGIDYSNYDSDYDGSTSTYLILADPDSRGLMTPDGRILTL